MAMWVWLGLFVVFVLIEAGVSGLVSLWFAAGSIAGLLAAALGAPIPVQILCFAIFSTLTLVLLRPKLKDKFFKSNLEGELGFERLNNAVACVLEDVSETAGAVTFDGKEWNARTERGVFLEKGSQCRITRIEGNRVYVAPLEADVNKSSESKNESEIPV
ncbi:MAG: NfeD family protein [Oscillospiraceae bacterium]|nr:NfeD family protein [Oscillospiraceae bacterium]